MPNPAVLLSPLTTQEAVLSSRIEGTQATLGDVLRFEAGEAVADEARREDIWEILNYRKALREAETELKARPFNLNLLKRMHAVLLDSVRGRDKGRGDFRREQNWIGVPGEGMDKAFFVPPPAVADQAVENAAKARAILELYARLKERVLGLTHSRYAVPVLDHLFRQPILTPRHLARDRRMPSKPMVMVLLKKLREAGILKSLREAAGPHPQVLALAELVNLCEGKRVV